MTKGFDNLRHISVTLCSDMLRGKLRGDHKMLLAVPAYPSVIDDQAAGSRGITFTVAERARAPIIGLRYGLPRYFAR
jgi:hypothetical protein